VEPIGKGTTMIRLQSRPLRLVAAGLTLVVVGAACAGPNPDKTSKAGKVEETTTTTIARGPDTTAAQLRSKLTGLLQEHVYLAAAVAASRGRADETAAAQSALDGNSKALSDNLTAIFTGSDSGVAKQFTELWKAGVAQNAGAIGSLLSGALPPLSAEAVSGPLSAAEQGIGSGTNFTALRSAASQMATLGAALAGAIHQKYPDRIGGDAASKGADLVTTLNAALREHVFLAVAATGAALGGRNDEFTGAKAALDANSDAVTGAIASVYGAAAGTQFAPLWKKHIDFLVDYTTAVAAKDQAKADAAMKNLLAYTGEFGDFISKASPKLTPDTVAQLVMTHVLTLKDVIDAQAAKNFTKAYNGERVAADHMAMFANSIATTVVAQFPDKF
jgi:hypothetical protein